MLCDRLFALWYYCSLLLLVYEIRVCYLLCIKIFIFCIHYFVINKMYKRYHFLLFTLNINQNLKRFLFSKNQRTNTLPNVFLTDVISIWQNATVNKCKVEKKNFLPKNRGASDFTQCLILCGGEFRIFHGSVQNMCFLWNKMKFLTQAN